MRRLSRVLKSSATAGLSGLATSQALAHHPMGGAVPTTAWQGLLSGLGHPVIEINHLLFLLGAATVVGLLKVAPGRAALALMLYAAASAAGTAIRVPGWSFCWLSRWLRCRCWCYRCAYGCVAHQLVPLAA